MRLFRNLFVFLILLLITFPVFAEDQDSKPKKNSSVYIGGGFVGGNDALLLDDSDGDGIWSGSTSLDAAGGHFTILNGNCSDWSCKEDISGQPCADALSYNDRNTLLGGFSQDTTLNLQFGSCIAPQIPSCTVYHADTINTFVSDTLFQNISSL